MATPAAARDRARQLHKTNPVDSVTIMIRSGEYRLAQPLLLLPDDSNTTYEAYKNERPVFTGGAKISGWKRGNGQLWMAPAHHPFRQLFVGDTRAQRARSPNEGFYRIAGPSSIGKPFVLPFRGSEIDKKWVGANVEIVILLLWSEVRMTVASVDDRTHTAVLSASSPAYKRESEARYWVENAPEALDQPGEWYYDRQTEMVSYWPLSRLGDDPSTEEITAPILVNIVEIRGIPEKNQFVRNVTFKGLEFKYTDWSMPLEGITFPQAALESPSAMELVGARDVSVQHCTFSHMGGYAIHLGRGSQHNQILNTEIEDMGAGGVRIGETTSPATDSEQVSGNTVSDNQIHNLGNVFPSAVGIWIGQSGNNLISHNHIHDLFYTAISMGWTWGYGPNACNHNVVEFNSLHDVGKGMLSDLAGIYTLGEQPGSVIRNNVIHDVTAWGYLGAGIYLDNGSSNLDVRNNTIYRARDGFFNQNNARDNSVVNNIFAFNSELQLMRDPPLAGTSSSFQRNIVVFDEGDLLDRNWANAQVRIDNNIYWRQGGEITSFGGKTLRDWRGLGNDVNSLLEDPRFVNAQNYDFRLLPGSPASKIAFEQIDSSTVGPRSAAGAGSQNR